MTAQARRRLHAAAAPTWAELQLDLLDDRSDAPRMPAHQAARMVRQGADPRPTSLLVAPIIRRRPRPRFTASIAGVAATIATVVTSPVVFDVALAVARLVLDGFAARLVAAIGVVVAVMPWLWRLAKWGVDQ